MVLPEQEMKGLTWEQVLASNDEAVLGQALHALFQEALNNNDIGADPYTEEIEPIWKEFANILRLNLTLRP